MGWNHRIVRYKTGELGIHEAYYNKKGDKVPGSITADTIAPIADDIEGMKWVLSAMTKALAKPILNYEDFNDDKKTSPDAGLYPLLSNGLHKSKSNKSKR